MKLRHDLFVLQEQIGGAWRSLSASSYLPYAEEMWQLLTIPGAVDNLGPTRVVRFRLNDLDEIAGISRDFEVIHQA